MSETSFKNHVYIAGRCTFCNINWLDENPDDPDHDCIERDESVTYTTNSNPDRQKLFNKPYTTDPAYYDFMQKQYPHMSMDEIKEEFGEAPVDTI